MNKKHIKKYWELEFEKYCKDLLDKDLHFHSKHPLKSFVKDYIYIRTSIINRILNRTISDRTDNNASADSEFFISVDGIVASIDLIYKNQDFVKLVDFKFGNILDDDNQIKELYKKQLYIYAAMYYLYYGIEPTILSISDKKFKEYNLEKKSIEYCIGLFEELKNLNNEIGSIKTEDQLISYARPNKENCKYCNVKIDCQAYWKSSLHESDNHLDIIGKVKYVKKGLDGIKLTLDTIDKGEIKIFKIPVKMEEQLNNNNEVAVINLFKEKENIHINYYYSRYSEIVFINKYFI
tara:strand:+ start:2286 stop:3164 length:879 start_codon:yes stop_codon:yes gene_type:complete